MADLTPGEIYCGQHVPGTSSNRCLLPRGHDVHDDDPQEPEPGSVSAAQPQLGDKVRVVVDSTVTGQGHYLGRMWVDDGTATLEILERADDPSRDLVGTVAERADDGALFVKVRINGWVRLADNDSTPGRVLDSLLRGRRVTGAVPGTPAARSGWK